jgi:hypothetical protein
MDCFAALAMTVSNHRGDIAAFRAPCYYREASSSDDALRKIAKIKAGQQRYTNLDCTIAA